MGMIELFKEQVDNESAKLAEARGSEKRGDRLMWWYFERLQDMSSDLVNQIVCDGHMDLGIDAIHIDDENLVHFYSFKNPETMRKSFPSGDVDKLISGLRLIIAGKESGLTNPELRDRLEEIRHLVPAGYRIHLVTSGLGAQEDCSAKLDNFIEELKGPSEFCKWQLEDLEFLHTEFYTRTLPTVEEVHEISLPQAPYQVRSAGNDCYMFDLDGPTLANFYEVYGEQLLQQNIRVSQGDNATNKAIHKTATGDDAELFFTYNNGVAFLAEAAGYDGFTHRLTLSRFQVVNGGQTIRMLHKALKESDLRHGVRVPVRVITSRGDKEFSNNVTVNLNNQNRTQPSFLRSNDPRVIQLASALRSKGWYLERRERELAIMGEEERAALQAQFTEPLAQRTIKLKDGMQAYVATYKRAPELAKKNPKRIFLGAEDGGMFDSVFDDELTAEPVITAHTLNTLVADYVKQFMTRKRRKHRVEDWHEDYAELLGDALVEEFGLTLDQVLPQSGMFLAALVFEEWVRIKKLELEDLVAALSDGEFGMLQDKLLLILREGQPESEGKSWPTLLKSQSFFDRLANFMRGRNSVRDDAPAT